MSRRAFLAALAAARATGSLGLRSACDPEPPANQPGVRPRAAPGKPRQAPVWALLADTHIHADRTKAERGFHVARNLTRVVAEVLEEGAGAALVNGDMAHTAGEPGDYRNFLELVEPWRRRGVAVHATLGNHDHRGNFFDCLGRPPAAAIPGVDKSCGQVELDGIRWLLLDSLEKVNQVPGELGKAQLRWVEEQLDAAPRLPTLLFVHHNVEAAAGALQDAAELLRVLVPRRQVKAIFFGHTHSWRRWEIDGLHLVNLPATAFPFKEGEPLGWVRAAPQADGLELELRSLPGKAEDPIHPDHKRKITLRWRPRTVRLRGF